MVDEKQFRKEIKEAYHEGQPKTKMYLLIGVLLLAVIVFTLVMTNNVVQSSISENDGKTVVAKTSQQSLDESISSIQSIRKDLKDQGIITDPQG